MGGCKRELQVGGWGWEGGREGERERGREGGSERRGGGRKRIRIHVHI